MYEQILKKHLETLDDVGEIVKHDGSSVGRRRYHLTISQDVHVLPDGARIEGLKSIDGSIDLQGHEGLGFMVADTPLTLKLADGRSLPFFFTDSDGQIAARGALI